MEDGVQAACTVAGSWSLVGVLCTCVKLLLERSRLARAGQLPLEAHAAVSDPDSPL